MKVLTVSSRNLRKHGSNGATPALVGPRCGKRTTERMTARILESNRRHLTQGALGENLYIPVMTQHAAQVRKASNREAGTNSEKTRRERDHGFTNDVTAVLHHDIFSLQEHFDPGPCARW